MKDSEFIEMMVDERIQCILTKKLSKEEAEIFSAGEKAIEEMEEKVKQKMKAFLDMTASHEAENETKLYLGGLHDGIRLMGQLFLICRESRDKEKDYFL